LWPLPNQRLLLAVRGGLRRMFSLRGGAAAPRSRSAIR
jgi:hypothetical protein